MFRAHRINSWWSRSLRLAALAGLGSWLGAQGAGFQGPSLAGSGPTVGTPSVTGPKPENKVWFNDGKWWASMWSSGAAAFHIYSLNQATHTWTDTGVLVESRPDSHSDALMDGTKLYIVSHDLATGGGKLGRPIQLLRYSYTAGAFVKDTGFPISIGDSSTTAATIEKDSTGKLWAVWKQGLRVYYNYSLSSDTLWSVPAPLPGSTTDIHSSDLCAIQRFGGNKIGVMWGDNIQANYLFAVHVDGEVPTTWLPNEVAWPGQADDHINLSADSTGRVFSVVKNGNEDIELLVRSTSGVWQQFMVIDGDVVADRLTRPIVLLNESSRKIMIFAQGVPDLAIHEKDSSLDTISFAPGLGTVVIRDGSGAAVNNPTSTRQNITPATGLVVLAANTTTAGRYWHHEVAPVVTGGLVLNPPSPGVAGVSNTFVLTGATPNAVEVLFASANTGSLVIPRPSCPGGILTQLASPASQLGSLRANASGAVTFNVSVPANLAGRTFQFQAIEAVSCRASNRIAKLF